MIVPDVPGLGESAPVPRLDVDTFARWFDAVLAQTHADRPTLVAHSLLGSVAARYAACRREALDRLVIYAAPGIGPYRMPLRLRYVAIRFAIRPTVRNAERFDRFALLDLDATRALDPHWFADFEEYTRARAVVPRRQADDAEPHQLRNHADLRRRTRRDHHADLVALGSSRPYVPAQRLPNMPPQPSGGRCTSSRTPATRHISSSPTRSHESSQPSSPANDVLKPLPTTLSMGRVYLGFVSPLRHRISPA